jgi:hypothetical protein
MWHSTVRKNCPKEHSGQESGAYISRLCAMGLHRFHLDVILDAMLHKSVKGELPCCY